MTQLKMWFQTHKKRTELLLLLCYFVINGIVNATTVIMQDMRDDQLSFLLWEPFVWELSSAFSTVLLIPLIARFTKKSPWLWHDNLTSLLRYLCAAIVFCFAHVALMVAMRELAYLFSSSDYIFADSLHTLLFEFLYELRKDVWHFFFFVIAIEVYRYAVKQWLGDISPIAELAEAEMAEIKKNSETVQVSTPQILPEKMLVRKLGKEFLISTRDIAWAQSSGNYLNLHINGEIYPMRTTLSEFSQKAVSLGFVRIHRSHIVNIHQIDHIAMLSSGDGEVELKSGEKVRLSRRYKSEFDQQIQQLSQF